MSVEFQCTESDVYVLKIKDTPLIEFSLCKDNYEELFVTLLTVNHCHSHLFPCSLELTADGILSWISNRNIPKNRAFVDEILKVFGLKINDVKAILDTCLALSLNDSYWVVKKDFTGTFSDFNLYENEFSEIVSLTAFTGVLSRRFIKSTSPELTTNGMLPKAWRRLEDNNIYLFKGGTSGACNTGNEPYSEYYASQIASRMGLNHVSYDLTKWKGNLCSYCKLFTDINTDFVPICSVIEPKRVSELFNFYKDISDSSYQDFCSMVIFDSLIYNEDRHLNNFGLLRDNSTGKLIGTAPIFDNGFSLFTFGTEERFNDIKEYACNLLPAFGVSFEQNCKFAMGKLQHSQLRKMINFKFKRHPKYNLPEWRLQKIEEHIQWRVHQLLQLDIRN